MSQISQLSVRSRPTQTAGKRPQGWRKFPQWIFFYFYGWTDCWNETNKIDEEEETHEVDHKCFTSLLKGLLLVYWAAATHRSGSASEQRVQSEAAPRVTSRLWKQLARSNCDGEQSLDTPDGMFHTSVGCYGHETAERLKELRRPPPKPCLWLDVCTFCYVQTRPIRWFHHRWWQLVFIHNECMKSFSLNGADWSGHISNVWKRIRWEVFKTELCKSRLENSVQIDGTVRYIYI